MCDEWYNPNSPDAKVHNHPEPQSGIYRDAWLDSRMSYDQWSKETRVGQKWLEYTDKEFPKMTKHTFQIEIDLGDGKGFIRNNQNHGNKEKAINAFECYKNCKAFSHAKLRIVETQLLERIIQYGLECDESDFLIKS